MSVGTILIILLLYAIWVSMPAGRQAEADIRQSINDRFNRLDARLGGRLAGLLGLAWLAGVIYWLVF